MDQQHYLVPEQRQGIKKDLEFKITTDTIADAEYWFVDTKERLLEVNSWTKYAMLTKGGFSLTDHHGKKVNRHARKGDHIIIDTTESPIPSENDYLVVIDIIEYDDYPDLDMETFAMHITHFSDLLQNKADGNSGILNDASGTIVVERRNKHVAVYYHGRNENGIEDTGIVDIDTSPVFDYWMGLAGTAWEQLVKGLVAP